MDNESEVIQQQMHDTREALQDKLETLEQQAKNTVEDATAAVRDTVEGVKETVQSVKDTFNVAHLVETHPMAMFLGATAVGFVAAHWLAQHSRPACARERQSTGPETPPAGKNGFAEPANANAAGARMPMPAPFADPPKGNWIADHYGEELATLKSLALGTLGGLVRELLTSSASQAMAGQIKEVVNGVTAKMGGHVMESPILSRSTPECPTASGAALEQRDSTNGDRKIAAAPC